MIYPNNREGRNQILDEIARLTAQGYHREDKNNKTVTLEKVVKKGKVCKEINIVRFIFNPSERTITSDIILECKGLEKARSMLFGWSSPNKEVSNAVKAGLLDETDKEILKLQYNASDWNKKK